MLTDYAVPNNHDLQAMFRLAYFLHPNRAVALFITLEACKRIPHIRKDLGRRSESSNPHKLKIPEGNIDHYAVFVASQHWERNQEQKGSKGIPRYQPTSDDALIRYIELLIWKSMDRNSCYAAVALGRLLYSYQFQEIVSLAPDYFKEDNIRRINGYFIDWIKERFQNQITFPNGSKSMNRRSPTDHERTLLEKSLQTLAPKFPISKSPLTPNASALESFFHATSLHSETERIRVLMDPTVVGIERLIHEYNISLDSTRTARLRDPQGMILIPNFDNKILLFPQNDAGDAVSDKRFNPEPLGETEIIAIKHGRGEGM